MKDTFPPKEFEDRKKDHIRLALRRENEALGGSGLESIQLLHEALPEINFDEVTLETKAFDQPLATPLLMSSMTAGHQDALKINSCLARAAESRGWLMGVGSQRREIFDSTAAQEWKDLRRQYPRARLLGNLGLSQLIELPIEQVQKLVDNLQAWAMIIHCNPLQECLQPEGTPRFRGGLKALENLSRKLSVPVVVKEVGCGFSSFTLKRLSETGVAAVDVSGYGGTHWGRIEGQRAADGDKRKRAAENFASWGLSTVESLLWATELGPRYSVWASGGVRSGLDAARLVALGAEVVGIAKPLLEAALIGEQALERYMETIEFELKVALFCSGTTSVNQLRGRRLWQWRKI